MKKLSAFSLIILLGICGALLADENYVTVYNQNLALVKQVRSLDIEKSGAPVKFTDVAAQIIPTSVHLQSAEGNKNLEVLEQNFEYDLVSADKILEKYIDHEVEIVKESGELVSGTLLSKSGRSLVIKTGDGIQILPWNDKMSVNVGELPEGLITRPTLFWNLAGVKPGNQALEVSYLTNGMNWHAEYVGILGEKDNSINVDAWVSIDNKCGATFEDAVLKLVAGEVHRAPQPRGRGTEHIVEFSAKAAEQPAFAEREFFEYHIYELGRKTTVKDNQIKQISLFPPTDVSSEKQFYYNGTRDPKKVEVRVIFKNSEKAGLGRPLPAGVFRIYQKDGESLEFIGEDRIDHTPRNEEVKITVGNAFDLVGERKVVDRQRISQRSERQTIEIELRNNKEKEDVRIMVEEYLNYPNWKIEQHNFDYQKKQANLIEFQVPVKAGDKTTLRYTVTYSW